MLETNLSLFKSASNLFLFLLRTTLDAGKDIKLRSTDKIKKQVASKD